MDWGEREGWVGCFAARNTSHYTLASYIRDYFSFSSLYQEKTRERQRARKSARRVAWRTGMGESFEKLRKISRATSSLRYLTQLKVQEKRRAERKRNEWKEIERSRPDKRVCDSFASVLILQVDGGMKKEITFCSNNSNHRGSHAIFSNLPSHTSLLYVDTLVHSIIFAPYFMLWSIIINFIIITLHFFIYTFFIHFFDNIYYF